MGAELNPAQRLHALGQSLWLDSINRVMLRTGSLARYVRDLAVTGLTSNPTILGHAMAAGSDYDSSLARLAGAGDIGFPGSVSCLTGTVSASRQTTASRFGTLTTSGHLARAEELRKSP